MSRGGRCHQRRERCPKTVPILRASAWRSSEGTNPSTRTSPLVGRRIPVRTLIVVDLPAPFAPTNATRSPGAIENVTSSIAWTSRVFATKRPRTAPWSPGARSRTRKTFDRCSTWMAGTGADMAARSYRHRPNPDGARVRLEPIPVGALLRPTMLSLRPACSAESRSTG